MKTVLIISSLFLLFACTNQGADKNQHIKELKKDTIRNGFELHQRKSMKKTIEVNNRSRAIYENKI